MSTFKILAASSLLVLFSGIPCFAQGDQANPQSTPSAPGKSPTLVNKPATSQDIIQLSTTGTISACILAQSKKASFSDALQASAFAVAWVIENFHGSMVEGSNVKIPQVNLFNLSAIQIIGNAKNNCYDKLSTDDKKFIDENFAKMEQQFKNAPKSK